MSKEQERPSWRKSYIHTITSKKKQKQDEPVKCAYCGTLMSPTDPRCTYCGARRTTHNTGTNSL